MDSYQNSRPFGSPIRERSDTPEGSAPDASPPPLTNYPFVARHHRGQNRDPQRHQTVYRRNEYFIPNDGIDSEVILADIGRYLGNDARVRIGQDPSTRTVREGYLINAYRNLTTAMIEDLKADTERWRAERTAAALALRGRTPTTEYGASTTHQSRQHYGPTEFPTIPASESPSTAAGYPLPAYRSPYPNLHSSNTAPHDPAAHPSTSVDSNHSGNTYARPQPDFPNPPNPQGAQNYPNPTAPSDYAARTDYPYRSAASVLSSPYYNPPQNQSPSSHQYPTGQNGGAPYNNRGHASNGYDNNRGESPGSSLGGSTQDYSQIPRTTPVTGSNHHSRRSDHRDSDRRDRDSDRRDRHSHHSRR